jgi:hypothetical protein
VSSKHIANNITAGLSNLDIDLGRGSFMRPSGWDRSWHFSRLVSAHRLSAMTTTG